MGWLSNHHNKSMFGQLLVRKKLISQEQLDRAIEQQRKTGQRLGDIFAEWNIITHEHVNDVLRTQRNVRMAAAIATSLIAPLEAYAAQALPALAVTAPLILPREGSQDGPAKPATLGSLQALSEEELSDTAAQGLNDELVHHVKQQIKQNSMEVVGDLVKVVNPVLGFLESDVSMKNVVYDPSKAVATINKDGSMTLSLPSSIGEINFNNIRVKGSEGGPYFGSITMRGIDLTGTTITVGFHH
ncbi:hypothetical protein HSX11_24045 [Oxalobacteraceae bacterium]|nr:hypothetical protein [Oxalobacteraceae bacterium]